MSNKNNPRLKLHHNVLVSQWQTNSETTLKYLCWRWFLAVIFLSIMIMSIIDVSGDERNTCDKYYYGKWMIYLTHWTMMFCATQSVLAGILCTFSFFGIEYKISSFLMNIYRPIYANALVFGYTITIWYWTLIHVPELHPVNLQNILAHIVMGLTMLLDLLISGHRLNIKNDIFYTTTVAIGFTIFTYIYYVSGGTNCKGERLIYPVLNWEEPLKTWMFCGGKAIFVAIVHLFIFSLGKIKVFVFKRHFIDEHLNGEELRNRII